MLWSVCKIEHILITNIIDLNCKLKENLLKNDYEIVVDVWKK